jgi:hypothetical protein
MNLVFVVNDLSPQREFSIEKLLLWLGPLKPERFGSIVVFEARTIQELALIMNQYEVENIVLASNYLVEKLGDNHIQCLEYQIRSEVWVGMQRNALLLPDVEDVQWSKLEPALDRFEELL